MNIMYKFCCKIVKGMLLFKIAEQWRSILVRSAVSQEGPKNPLKGTTVKPLVLASYAQFGVGAGWKVRLLAPADFGRAPMAWRCRPGFRGDLLLWTGVLPWWSKRPSTKQMY